MKFSRVRLNNFKSHIEEYNNVDEKNKISTNSFAMVKTTKGSGKSTIFKKIFN